MGEKAATNEVITKLVSALGDQSDRVRMMACEALGKMGVKAATNEVITKLVSALGDQSDRVRMMACEALGKMGEKVATNEVIVKLVILINSDSEFVRSNAANAVGNILTTVGIITQLDPKIISNLFLSQYGSCILENVSVDQLMRVFFIDRNLDWLAVVTQFTLLKGAAVTATEDKVVVYAGREPLELIIPSSQLRHQLIEAFTDQAKRLHLFFEEPFNNRVEPKR
jgi:hypothetical protein